MFPDLGFVFTWWLFIFGIGLIFLPLTKKIFADFFDKGYLFSKVLGLLFSSYLVWLLATFKILPFSRDTIWLVLVIGLIVNLILLRKKISLFPGRTGTSHSQPIFHSPSLFLIFILEELMFLATLAFWSFIRGFQQTFRAWKSLWILALLIQSCAVSIFLPRICGLLENPLITIITAIMWPLS